MTWNQLKELIDQKVKEAGLSDVEIWTIDIWKPDNIKIYLDTNYDEKLEKELDHLFLHVRDI